MATEEERPAADAAADSTARAADTGPSEFVLETYQRMKRASEGLGPSRGRLPARSRRRTAGAGSDGGGDPTPDHGDGREPGWAPPPGIAHSRSGTGRSWRDPQDLHAILNRTTLRRQWKVPLSLGSIAAEWPDIVGESVALHSTVESLEEGRLLVRTDSTAWAKQLQLLVPQIERRLDEVVGGGIVTQVVVHGPQPPSWKHGLRSVPGRGPRDTYG